MQPRTAYMLSATILPSPPNQRKRILSCSSCPPGGKVDAALAQNPKDLNEIIVNGFVVILYTISESKNFALDTTSVGNALLWYHWPNKTTHISKYKLLILNAPKYIGPKSPSTVGTLVTESLIMVEWSMEATLELAVILPLGE